MRYEMRLNGRQVAVEAEPGTPLLWVLREGAKLTGPKFGCGLAQCGACMVLLEGRRTFSCQVPVEAAAGRAVTTVEGLNDKVGSALKSAWIAEAVPQCGYCQSGQLVSAADLLASNPRPTREQIKDHMTTNLCRCGTYGRIVKAVERASRG
jgi:isoquinoline 1-oxidoreductase alpha subunit